MLEKSVFTEEELKSFIKKEYDIDVNNIRKINVGSANIYSINNDKYILKEFQSKYNENEIIKEINVINHLRKNNLLVPKYIETKNNKYFCIYKGKAIIMQEFIKGDTLEKCKGTKEQIIECARELGKLTSSLKSLEYELPIREIDNWFDLEKGINKKEKLLNITNDKRIIKDLKDKIEMSKYCIDKFNINEIRNNLTITNCHGDYNLLQFIYDKGKIKAIIDFVSASKMPIVWEIIRSYSYIDPKCKDGDIDIDNLVEYTKEVNKYFKLNKYDLKYMSYVYLIQLLNSDYGYKQYIEDNNKKELLEFGLFRTKLCKTLFKKSNEISKRLLNEVK